MEMRQVPDRPFPACHAQFGAIDLVVRTLEEALEHPELVEDFHRRRMDSVAAEVAEEVRMLLEDAHRAAGASEQQSGHHARRAATYDNEVRIAF